MLGSIAEWLMKEVQPSDAATPVVSAFYDRFPFPGDPLQDGPPPGYNWRWCHRSVLASVHGVIPAGQQQPRILDAGCGTGVSTDYLCHLNPGAEVVAVDISDGALAVARERLERSEARQGVRSLRQEQRSLLDLGDETPFDYINSVGVLHHLREPEAGLAALADLLAPQGLLHLFLYADAGRWEIHRTQKALMLLQAGTGGKPFVSVGTCSKRCLNPIGCVVTMSSAGLSTVLPMPILPTCISTHRRPATTSNVCLRSSKPQACSSLVSRIQRFGIQRGC